MADWQDLLAQNNAASSPQTQATTDLLRQQAIGAMQENRVRALQLQYQQALGGAIGAAAASQPGSGGGQPSGGVFGNAPPTLDPRLDDPANAAESSGVANSDEGAGSGHQLNTAAAIAGAQRLYQPVLPNSYSPAEIQALQIATLSGNDAAVKFIQQQHAMKVESANAAIQQRAQQEYNGLYGVVNAPGGRALDALSLVEPRVAAKLQGDGATDSEVRQWATQLSPIVHRAARLPVEYGTDGEARDANTKEKIPGFDDYVGLSAQQRADLSKQATEPVDTFVNGVAAKQPRWKVEGNDSAQDWLSKHVDLAEAQRHGTGPAALQLRASVSGPARVPGALPPGTQPNAAWQGPNSQGGTIPWLRPQQHGQVPAQPVPPQQGPTQPPPQQAPSSQTPPAPGGPQNSPAANVDPRVYNDPDFKLKAPSIPAGQAMSPEQLDQRKATVQARTDLLKDSGDATSAASQSLQYLKAAKAIMASKGAPVTGLFGPAAAEISRVWGGVNATNYQEVAKYLGNAALASAKQNYGARMTQSEVGLQLNELSPSTHMTPIAINNLIDTNIRNAQYSIDSAKRVRAYLNSGNDPQLFAQWNQQYFPRDQAVNSSGLAVGTVRGSYRFNGGDPSNKANWKKVQQ